MNAIDVAFHSLYTCFLNLSCICASRQFSSRGRINGVNLRRKYNALDSVKSGLGARSGGPRIRGFLAPGLPQADHLLEISTTNERRVDDLFRKRPLIRQASPLCKAVLCFEKCLT